MNWDKVANVVADARSIRADMAPGADEANDSKPESTSVTAIAPGLLNVSVVRSSTTEQLAAALRRAIMLGEIKPGTPLPEIAVASAAEVARSTAREALQLLAHQRLVVRHHNRGATVVTPSESEVRDVYRTREILETAALSEWRQAPPEARHAVAQATRRLELAATDHNWETLSDRDMGFHAAIVGLLGSARLDGFFANLSAEVQFYAALLYAGNQEREDPVAVAAEHSAIYSAVRNGDLDQGVALCRRLLEANRDLLIEILRRHPPQRS